MGRVAEAGHGNRLPPSLRQEQVQQHVPGWIGRQFRPEHLKLRLAPPHFRGRDIGERAGGRRGSLVDKTKRLDVELDLPQRLQSVLVGAPARVPIRIAIHFGYAQKPRANR